MRGINFFTKARRLLIDLPIVGVSWWSVLGAIERSDWAAVVRGLERIDRHGGADDELHFRLAIGYAMAERWADAEKELDRIEKTLPRFSDEACRQYNHCLVLARLGKLEDAMQLAAACKEVRWPEHLSAPFRQLTSWLAVAGDGNGLPPVMH